MMSLLLLSAAMAPPPLRQRTVAVTPNLDITVFELSSPGDLVQQHWTGQSSGKDPFGTVLWPGALFAARKMCARPELIRDRDVLCLGTGTGLEALTAASLGARQVIACDYNQLTLNLLEDAARHAGLDDRLSTRVLDLTSRDTLPAAPVHVYADVLYNLELSLAIARRCRVMLGGDGAAEAAVAAEAASAAADDGGVGALPRWLLLTDSQRFHSAAFLEEINQGAEDDTAIEWEQTRLESFTGSGILLEEDQTYSAEIRFLDRLVE